VNEIKQQIKTLNTTRENKIELAELLHKIERAENEKVIYNNDHDYFFVSGKYCGCR